MAKELPLVSGLLWSTLVRSEAGTTLSSSGQCPESDEGKDDGFQLGSQQPGAASPCPSVGQSFAVV